MGKRRRGRRSERWITHYSSSHKILLVGEGDFSFSSCLASSFGSAKNMVATSFDSEDELRAKHWSSVEHLQELKRLGCTVLHDVDVNGMHEHVTLRKRKFDRIVFNFPHAGHDPMYCERHPELIRKHKELLMAFLVTSREMISENGEIHVSHRNDYPYIRWKLQKLAKKAGLILIDIVEFVKADYPGYHNKRGGGIKSNKTFPLKDCYTFKFSLPKCSETHEGNLKSSSHQCQSKNKSDKTSDFGDSTLLGAILQFQHDFLQFKRDLQDIGIASDPSIPTHNKGQETTKISSGSDNPISQTGPSSDHRWNYVGLPKCSEMDEGSLKSGNDQDWSRNKSDKTSDLVDPPFLMTTFQVQHNLQEAGVAGDPSLPTHNKGQGTTKISSGSDNPISRTGLSSDHMLNYVGLPKCSEMDEGSLKSGSDQDRSRNKSDKASDLVDLPFLMATFQVQHNLQEVGVAGDPSLPTHNKSQGTSSKISSCSDNLISRIGPRSDLRRNHVGLPKCSETDERSLKSGNEFHWQNHVEARVDSTPPQKKFIFILIFFFFFLFLYISQPTPSPP